MIDRGSGFAPDPNRMMSDQGYAKGFPRTKIRRGRMMNDGRARKRKVDLPIPDYRIKFIDLLLRIDKLEIASGTLAFHAKLFAQGKLARFPFSRTILKTRSVPAGESYVKIDNLFIIELPNNCIVTMVKSTSYNGSITENPFYFRHFYLNYFAFKVNSEVIPPGGLNPDFEATPYKNPTIMREYRRLFDHTGIGFGNLSNDITPEYFRKGMTFFPHDFTPDRCLGYHNHLKKTGNIDLELRFAKPLTDGITVLALGSFDDFIEIDATRNVVFRAPTTV